MAFLATDRLLIAPEAAKIVRDNPHRLHKYLLVRALHAQVHILAPSHTGRRWPVTSRMNSTEPLEAEIEAVQLLASDIRSFNVCDKW